VCFAGKYRRQCQNMSRHITTRSSMRSLRSSSASLLQVPFRRTSFGKRSFSTAAPSVWNSLPTSDPNCDSLTLFKASLRTYLFSFVLDNLDLSASASEAMAPRHCINRVLYCTERLHFVVYEAIVDCAYYVGHLLPNLGARW